MKERKLNGYAQNVYRKLCPVTVVSPKYLILYSVIKINLSKTKLDPSYVNKWFSYPDSHNRKDDLRHNQSLLESNLTEENLDFIDHNYFTSENTSLLMEVMKQRCSLVVRHLNIKSLTRNYDKLQWKINPM